MTPQEITEAALVLGTRRIFVLGCFEQRVTVYSQQVRAINLVDAILSQEMVRLQGGKVAIVGAGVAGMTAAVAFAKAAPALASLDVFERRHEILQLQRNSRRYLHPHFYDWPSAGAELTDAGLPIMNWQAGLAGDVANVLLAEFNQSVESSRLTVHTNHQVIGLKPSEYGPVRVVTDIGPAFHRIYDAVILAIGFGIERFIDKETSSYWTPTELSAPILANVVNPLIFISGNGDGGLVDFLIAAFNGYEHDAICRFLIELDLGQAMVEIEAIEREAWAVGADVDILAQYQARVGNLIPPKVWSDINERMRPNVRICLHTRETRLLRRETALHNRLATFLMLTADADPAIGHNAIVVKVGVNFEGEPPITGDAIFADGERLEPFKRFLRLGPNAEENLKSFKTLLEANQAAAVALRSATRPTSPRLTPSAINRFEHFRTATEIPNLIQRLPTTAPLNTQNVSISLTETGQVAWAGGTAPTDIQAIGINNATVNFYCDVRASDATGLLSVIARLGAHSSNFTLLLRDSKRWHSALNRLWSDQTHPGPNISLGCAVEEWRDPPMLFPVVQMPAKEFSDSIHEQLDAYTLRKLHDALFDILGPGAAATGWMIEPTLSEQLLQLWQVWHANLRHDSATRRRFLRLLVSVNDATEPSDDGLVRIGNKIVAPYLTMPTIFALAFSNCSGHAILPATRHPGNISINEITGHTCGVEWISHRAIRGDIVESHGWTTSIVLLSGLREAVQMIEGDVRLDQVSSDAPRVGVTSLSDKPIVIGADNSFLIALETGGIAVEAFFQSIFERRAEAARESLEEIEDEY